MLGRKHHHVGAHGTKAGKIAFDRVITAPCTALFSQASSARGNGKPHAVN
jgi:hypothetical protein